MYKTKTIGINIYLEYHNHYTILSGKIEPIFFIYQEKF